MSEETRTEISEMGEFKLIEHLTKNFKLKNDSSIKGVGDDAAVLRYIAKCTIVTTDMLLEGVHFDLMYVPLKHLGYKAVVVNLSDIYAMNATPRQITVSIALSNRFSVEAISEFYEGVYHACEKYGVDLVGGDTNTSLSGFIISVTAIGEVEKLKITYRSGAKKNDLICVSGDLGGAYMGLQLLEREKKIFLEHPEVQPDLEQQAYIVGRQLMPDARKDIVELLDKLQIVPTSMIDISDGLSSEILHICNQSGVGCRLYEDKIPVAEETRSLAIKMNIDPTTAALNGGEDYELLFTIAQKDYEKIKNNPDITLIGHITEKEQGTKLVTRSNNEYELLAQGWNAFPKNQS